MLVDGVFVQTLQWTLDRFFFFLKTVDFAKINLKLTNVTNYLFRYNINVWYIPGAINIIPDVFSRFFIFLEKTDIRNNRDILMDLPFEEE